ncbi:DUF4132 domain-containing protein [Streptomyces sp. NBC_00525]|uniref:DUF4132 domain-containing protein n=1 Tax=Streptomyces sp. NBC_00525 TaxID=2903660 RepID=UPI002E81307A|nr:DUF4132 domain-containing protein [Streptomyces sp. NBC_00525]WUC97007.1 DUF4132 domain-containing protein [Streptomyces sp. NBC_00525]
MGTEHAVENGASRAGTAGADENTFVFPDRWQRLVIPRRGGIKRAPARVEAELLDTIAARTAEERAWIGQFLDAPGSDQVLVAEVRRHLDGDPSPAGAAAVASIVGMYSPPPGAWADSWVRLHGLPFAARAAVELFMTEPHYTQTGGARHDPWLEARTEAYETASGHYSRVAADRLRTLIAAAGDETYRATVEALAACRTDSSRKAITAFLAPSESGWVAELCTDPKTAGTTDAGLLSLVLCSLNSPEQAAHFTHTSGFDRTAAVIATAAEGIGSALAPMLVAELRGGRFYGTWMRDIADALVEFPTDEAFTALLDHSDDKNCRPALLEAMRRYPVRALRLLAADARDRAGLPATTSAGLLPAHIAAHRDLVAEVLPTLDAGLAEIVEPLLHPANRIADAPADALPAVLTSPPWTRPRSKAKPAMVTGLTAADEPALLWRAGEREDWAATESWYTRRDAVDDWERVLTSARYGLNEPNLRSAWIYVHGPEELVAPLLAGWDPTDLWDGLDTLKPVAARFGLDALPLLLRVVPRQPGGLAPLLLPFVDARIARHMADWSVRLKSAAVVARSWFERHGVRAAPLLVPDAVGKAGAARRAAEQALRLIAASHGDSVVRAAAEGYGKQAAEAVAALLAADPLERALPATMPALPDWADPVLLPQIEVASGGALPDESVRHVVTMLALSKPGEPYPGLADVLRTVDPASAAAFAWALFEQWRGALLPAKESWTLYALGVLGNDDTVRRLTPVIRAWPGENAHHRAVEGLSVLAAIGSDTALLHLHGISQRVKFKALKVRAAEKIAEVAAGLGLTGEQLSDRLVPDLGLDADGSTVIDYGGRTFTVGFDEQLRPYVLDGDGKRRKDLPKPGVRDDAELAPAERKRFMALKKDVRTIASDQVRRLEAAMVAGRSWTAQEFAELFVGHPLMWHLVRRLVWLSEADGTATAFRVAEDRTFADVEDDTFELPEGASVRAAHPLDLGGAVTDWSEVFADYEILQPFPQLGRPVFALTDEEAAGHRMTRFEGIKVPTGRLLGLERFGWRRGTPLDNGVERWISKRLADHRHLVIALDEGIAVGMVDMFPEQVLETVWLAEDPSDYWHGRPHDLRFGELDAVTTSELLADLTALTEGAAA